MCSAGRTKAIGRVTGNWGFRSGKTSSKLNPTIQLRDQSVSIIKASSGLMLLYPER